jgi:hypothetical protein
MSGLISGPFRAIFSFLLGIALFLALWETALFNVSARQTAVGLMTEAGVGLINPALEHSAFGTFGLSESGFASLQALAAARPDDPVAIPGLNVEVRGREITGKSFDDASRVVYGKVAEKFYDGGAGAAFSVPTGLQQAVGLLSFIPVLGGASANLNSSASTTLQPLAAVGLSLNTLTAAGHAQVQTFMFWLWGAAGVLALLIILLSAGWSRVTHVAHAFIGSSVLGVALIGLVWYLWQHNPTGFASFDKPLQLVGGAFAPVYLGALLAGLAGYAIAFGGSVLTKSLIAGRAVQQRAFAHMESPARERPPFERNQPYAPRQYGPNAYPPSSGAPPYPPRSAPPGPGYGSSQQPGYGSGLGGQPPGWGDPGQPPSPWPDQDSGDQPRRPRY